MKHDRYSSKPAGRPAQKLIGGGKTLNISVLRGVVISNFVIFIISFLCVSCEKEIPVDDDAVTRSAQPNDSTGGGGLGLTITIDTVWKGETHITF